MKMEVCRERTKNQKLSVFDYKLLEDNEARLDAGLGNSYALHFLIFCWTQRVEQNRVLSLSQRPPAILLNKVSKCDLD